jgi:hypothetical protein
MNQKLELSLESLIGGNLFKVNIPWGVAYDDALQALQQFVDQIIQMKENQIKQQAANNTSSSTVDKMSTD